MVYHAHPFVLRFRVIFKHLTNKMRGCFIKEKLKAMRRIEYVE